MKRIGKITVLVLLVLVILFAVLRKSSVIVPQFVPARTIPGSSLFVSYSEYIPRYVGGMTWGRAVWPGGDRLDPHESAVLFNVETRTIVGELLHAEPDFLNHDQTSVLCRQVILASDTFKGKVNDYLDRFSGGRVALFGGDHNVEIFWLVDLRSGSAKRVAQLTMPTYSDNECTPSPGSRYGYRYGFNSPTGARELFLCDLEKSSLIRFKIPGDPFGWWDDHTIIMQNAAHDLLLLDVLTGKTNALLSAVSITQSLGQLGLTNRADSVSGVYNWNGLNYDHFLAAETTNSDAYLLVQIDHAGPSLRLVATNLPSMLGSDIDAALTRYAYARTASGTNQIGGIILRDLRDNSEIVIDSSASGSFSFPQMYGDGILYCNNSELWRSDLNGSNHVRLLPPPDK